jgi:HSP20 family protein
MNLMRWEPFYAMENVFNRFPSLLGPWPQSGKGEFFDWSPSVDISETDADYRFRAALPGVRKEDVKVTYEGGMLTLSGERCHKEEQKNEKFHKVESFYGNFSRSFVLPDSVDADAITAESKEGVLTVRVPKTKVETKKLGIKIQ